MLHLFDITYTLISVVIPAVLTLKTVTVNCRAYRTLCKKISNGTIKDFDQSMLATINLNNSKLMLFWVQYWMVVLFLEKIFFGPYEWFLKVVYLERIWGIRSLYKLAKNLCIVLVYVYLHETGKEPGKWSPSAFMVKFYEKTVSRWCCFLTTQCLKKPLKTTEFEKIIETLLIRLCLKDTGFITQKDILSCVSCTSRVLAFVASAIIDYTNITLPEDTAQPSPSVTVQTSSLDDSVEPVLSRKSSASSGIDEVLATAPLASRTPSKSGLPSMIHLEVPPNTFTVDPSLFSMRSRVK